MKEIFLSLLLLITACAEADSNIEKVEINASIAKEYYLDEIGSDIKVIALEAKGEIFANVTNIKSYGEYNLIFDEYNMQIHAFDTDFKYINTLDRRGKGPQEYIDFSTFSYNEHNNEITIFERTRQMLISYSMPDFKYVGRKKYDGYIMAMESVSSDALFIVKESDYEIQGAIELLDISKDSVNVTHSMDIGNMSPELSPDQTITRLANSTVFYTLPNFINTIYRITEKEFIPTMQIDFGKLNIPEKYWSVSSDSELNLADEMADNEFVAMPQYSLIGEDSAFSCWFITMPSAESQRMPRVMLYNQNERGDKQVVSSLKLHDMDDFELQPVGLIDGYYASIIHPDEVSAKQSKSEITTKIIELSENESSLILILYKVKVISEK